MIARLSFSNARYTTAFVAYTCRQYIGFFSVDYFIHYYCMRKRPIDNITPNSVPSKVPTTSIQSKSQKNVLTATHTQIWIVVCVLVQNVECIVYDKLCACFNYIFRSQWPIDENEPLFSTQQTSNTVNQYVEWVYTHHHFPKILFKPFDQKVFFVLFWFRNSVYCFW